MKRAWLIFSIILFTLNSNTFSQDLIVTKTDSVKCKILDVDTASIEFSYLNDGIMISNTFPISEIISYKYNYFDNIVSTRLDIKEEYPKIRWAVDGGYSRRIGRMPDGLSSVERTYINKLKSGFNFGTDFNFYLSKTYGLGIKYLYFAASSQMDDIILTDNNSGNQFYGTLSDHTVLQTIGPLFTSRLYDDKKLNFFNVSAGLGYSFYSNEGEAVISKFSIDGGCYTSFVELGYDRMISSKTAVGIRLTMLAAVLYSYNYTQNGVQNSRSLSAEEAENLSRIDISIGFRFLK